GDELPRRPRAPDLARDVPGERAPPYQEPEPAAHGGQLPGDRRRVERARVQVGEVAPDRPGVDVAQPGGRVTRAGILRDLEEIGPVASEGVRRGVLFEREVAQERGERILHVTASSTSRSKSHPSRAQLRTVRFFSTRSVTKAAPHFGHGSLTGRRQTTN